MTPKQDENKLYNWRVEFTVNIGEAVNNNWSVTTVASSNSFYLRRRRPLPEQD